MHIHHSSFVEVTAPFLCRSEVPFATDEDVAEDSMTGASSSVFLTTRGGAARE